ncbi:MAG: TetR/AcrR family transcriptional regulator [Calditrichaeota bacterium]|nr:TetR/AcrR family transcriptional regulator [Calditrichota bacterium]
MSTNSGFLAQDTKSKIFLTATDLFARFGYDRVSIRQICEAVGVQKPTLYYYFRDKESLLLETIRFTGQVGEQIFGEFVDSKSDFLEKIKGTIWARKYFIEHYPQFFHFHGMMHFFSIPENVKQELIKHIQLLSSKFRSVLEEGRKQGYVRPDEDMELLMDALIGTLNHLTIRKIVFNDEQVFSDKNLEQLFDFWKSHFFVNPANGGNS